MTNYTKFAVRGTVKVLIISLVAGFLGYVVRAVLARNLGVEDFGLFNSVFAFLGLIGAFDSLGFDKALVKFIPEFRHRNRNDFIKSSLIYVCAIMLLINIVIIAAVYLLSSYLSFHYFHSAKADIVLKILVIGFFIDSFASVLKFAFQGFKELGYYSMIDVIRMALVLLVVYIGIKLNYGILGPAVAYTIAPLILLLIFGWIFLRKVFPAFFESKFVLDKKMLKDVSKYSIFVTETTAAGLILYYTDILALTYFADLKSVGLYSVALPTARVLIYFTRALGGVVLPLTAELWVKEKKVLLKDGIELLYKYSFIAIVPIVFVMVAFSDLIISVFYGKNYLEASMSMKILSVGMMFTIFNGVNISFFSGIGKPKIGAIINYTAAVFNFVLNILLIPYLGILGAAMATTISYFAMMITGLYYTRRYINLTFPVMVWVKTFAVGLFFVFIIWYMKKIISLNVWIETPIVIFAAGAFYIAALFALRIVDLKELKMLYSRIAGK